VPFDTNRYIGEGIEQVRSEVGQGKAITALSGGVDSFVSAAIGSRAIDDRLIAIYVDTGLMRKGEREQVEKSAQDAGINLTVVDASDRFFGELEGVSDPEKKRKIIGNLFIRIFEEEAKKHDVGYLIQGTIAPDWIESGGDGTETIKSHHNVGGLPENMNLKLIEPLRELYKHEVRLIAKELGLPKEVHERQPFPGPALAIRVVGEVSREKVEMVRDACFIVEEEIERAVAEEKMERPWQYFAALLPSKTVGVAGDSRHYKYIAVVRSVRSLDGMTVNFSRIPYDTLQKISTRITNEIDGIGRVTYDITNKPPGTVEME
jgi:GMP synthase (glutamine-hydrolysing)